MNSNADELADNLKVFESMFPLVPTRIAGIPVVGPEKYMLNKNIPHFLNALGLSEIDQPKYFYLSRDSYTALIREKRLYDHSIDCDEPLDMPFSTTILDTNFTIFLAKNKENQVDADRPHVVSLFCKEILPGQYSFGLAAVLYHRNGSSSIAVIPVNDKAHIKVITYFFRRVFHRKSKCNFVDEKTSLKIKIGKKSGRSFLKVSRITHIVLGGENKQSPILGGTIDWNHCWGVRGHWRVCAGLGKDREGNYTVSGYTWVVPHIKGNQEAPFVEKTKILKIISNQEAS